MEISRKKIEQLPSGPELDELADFYLNQSSSTKQSFEEYIRPISSAFLFNGQRVIFNGTPPYSEDERLADHLSGVYGLNVERLRSGDYRVTFQSIAQLAPVIATTKALAVCRAVLIKKLNF